MAESYNAGGIYYEVDIELKKALEDSEQLKRELKALGDSAKNSTGGIKALETQAKTTATAVNQATKAGGAFRSQFQQAGYQIQDFIVQVQGGQSALVAFSQQGSQLAGAFGPGGAIVGAVIALGTVIAGTLITALSGGKNAMDALREAADAMDKVITISQNGVAALSDKYANLARVNAEVASLMRNQVLLEYNQAMTKVSKTISDTTSEFFSFGDTAKAALSGGTVSVKLLSTILDAAEVKTNSFTDAFNQVSKSSIANEATISTFTNTVGALSSRLGITDQAAFELAKQLNDLSKNPSPQALQALALRLQDMTSSSKDGQAQITALAGKLVDLAREAANAKFNVDSLKRTTDNLTDGQKNLLKQAERNLSLSKLQGEARARLAAQYAAEDAGFAKDDPHAKKMEDDAVATYKNLEATKQLNSEQKKSAGQASRNAQVLEQYRQKAELSADSVDGLSRAQAVLQARQKLVNPTPAQIAQVEKDAGAAWDKAAAIRAQAAAMKLIPEQAENTRYKQDVADLKIALEQKTITQKQHDAAAEQMEQQHQVNLAKIRATQNAGISPLQEAQGAIDPVQALANENAKKLALIQEFESAKGQVTLNGLALMNAANTQYEQQRIAAQWEIYRSQSEANELLASAVDSLQGGATNAITGLLNGTQSLSEAFANIGSTILNSVVSSLVEVGLQYVKNALIGQAMSRANTTSSAIEASTLATAWAPAAMAASIATQGKAAAIGSLSYNAAMASASFLTPAVAGAREHGGPVQGNSMYRVGEGGKPEIFKASNGSQYMIPGDNGSVISNKDIGNAGGGNVIHQEVNFHITTTGGIDAATQKQLAGMMKQVALFQMKEESTRGGGMLQPRQKK
ncbi:tail protein (tape measure) [Cronobacter sakazakii]|uniref:tail protein (tape measure) n=1 Tax=Cronobacter sakazakii TaxID=28141 RepID=UPI001ED4B852|nr:tail protein (tape measure) [Cronobacter sakazakii]EGT4441101.1 tail protein (tape measure) [Cronobacter sakazakii]UNM56586.1 tail protein (tape measure) [Cronobacter sakazakii]